MKLDEHPHKYDESFVFDPFLFQNLVEKTPIPIKSPNKKQPLKQNAYSKRKPQIYIDRKSTCH